MPTEQEKIREQAESDYLASLAGNLHSEYLLRDYGQGAEQPPTPEELAALPEAMPVPPLAPRKRKPPLLVAAIAVLVTALLIGCTWSVIQLLNTREGDKHSDVVSVNILPSKGEYIFDVPAGYTLEYVSTDEAVREVILANSAGENIFLTLFPDEYALSVDNEVMEYTIIRLQDGTEAFLTRTGDGCRLVWGKPGIICVVRGDVPEDMLIALANSVEKV